MRTMYWRSDAFVEQSRCVRANPAVPFRPSS